MSTATSLQQRPNQGRGPRDGNIKTYPRKVDCLKKKAMREFYWKYRKFMRQLSLLLQNKDRQVAKDSQRTRCMCTLLLMKYCHCCFEVITERSELIT